MQAEPNTQSVADTNGCEPGGCGASECATSEPVAKSYRLVRADLPSLLMTMHGYTSPANAYLDHRITMAKEQSLVEMAPQEAVRTTPHFEAIKEWTRANPDEAAKIVLCSVYLSNGRYVAQEEVEPKPEPEKKSEDDGS